MAVSAERRTRLVRREMKKRRKRTRSRCVREVDYEREELFAIWHTLMYDLRRVAKLFDGNTKKLAFQPFNVKYEFNDS